MIELIHRIKFIDEDEWDSHIQIAPAEGFDKEKDFFELIISNSNNGHIPKKIIPEIIEVLTKIYSEYTSTINVKN